MTEATKPLAASFILLSYNQEDTIVASAQSVLDQACEPIEVILSDDASTDETFKKISDLAHSYRGPHRIVARQNAVNMGVNRHIERAIKLADSDLMIWTAGDDINFPHRAQRIIDAYRKTGAKLIFSDAQTVLKDGSRGSDAYKRALLYHESSVKSAAISFALYLGATAAWHKDLYRKYGGFPAERAYEDLILGFRAVLEDSIHYIEEELVLYHESIGVSSQLRAGQGEIDNRTRRIEILRNLRRVLEQRLKDADIYGLSRNDPARRVLVSRIHSMTTRLDYYRRQPGATRRFLTRPLTTTHAFLSEMLRDFRKR
ncbi:glycosyl transferase [Pelagivirga sediminicola]|uniref:Glycosyl transferase n=1 Tax=Pelagivirga sediminicola TaxID=2170575 RepID=A0A2T7GAV1_9RHOB|nr:glycosyltransferase [Pelagivirga sediminicola]PVA11533.1 glycosyl transferase [Pelagivirga sediminicola]